jgi:subtilase family serine protease
VKVTPQPDLLVKTVTVTQLTVDQGKSLDITVVVKNNGLRDAGASTLKFVLVSTGATPLSKNLKGTVDVPAVPKSSELPPIKATAIVYDDTVLGSYNVRACIDSEKVIDETLESNNCTMALGTVTVTGVPVSPADLKVTALVVPPPPASFLPGQAFPLTATVENHGTGASPSTTTKFYLVNAANLRTILKGVQIVDPVAVGVPNTKPVTVQVYPGTAPPGSYRVQACADGKKELHELNEDDNCFTGDSITVLPAPNLAVTHVGDPPATANPGQQFAVTGTTVTNDGPVAALASVVRFFLVSTVDATIRIDMDGSLDVPPFVLNAPPFIDQSTTVKVRAVTLPGLYKVQACADGGKDILEGNEDDNCALSAKAVQVAAMPDLIVNAVTLPLPPVTVARGAKVTLSAVVKNQGSANAVASSVKFSLVKTPGPAPITKLPEIVPVLAVAASGEKTATGPVTIPTDTPVGTYYVQACADTANVVVEVSDTNNCGTSVDTLVVK